MQRQNFTAAMRPSTNYPPHVVKALVKAVTTTEGYWIIHAHMLSEHTMDQWMNLNNPAVHALIQATMDLLKEKQKLADEFAKKMRKIQRIIDQYEADMRDEANWIDVKEKEERPFILEGKRMSMSDIQVLLELAVKINMLADSQVIASWLQNRH